MAVFFALDLFDPAIRPKVVGTALIARSFVWTTATAPGDRGQGLPKNDVMSKQIAFDRPSPVRISIVSSARPSFSDTDCAVIRAPGFFEYTHQRSARTPSVS